MQHAHAQHFSTLPLLYSLRLSLGLLNSQEDSRSIHLDNGYILLNPPEEARPRARPRPDRIQWDLARFLFAFAFAFGVARLGSKVPLFFSKFGQNQIRSDQSYHSIPSIPSVDRDRHKASSSSVVTIVNKFASNNKRILLRRYLLYIPAGCPPTVQYLRYVLLYPGTYLKYCV